MSRSEALTEKQRKQKEHREKILKQHGAAGVSRKKPKPPPPPSKPADRSAFEQLFQTRAQGFQVEFKFRNAPPRPPVGPTFVGNSLDAVLKDECRRYKPLNSVEVNYTWRLHSEPDLGVPLAPSAMDVAMYQIPKDDAAGNKKPRGPDDMDIDDDAGANGDKINKTNGASAKLDPDDEALLDWKGSMGDTAADDLKRRQERARVAARLALAGKSPPSGVHFAGSTTPQQQQQQARTGSGKKKKVFSRVLKEEMPTFMKKTTYLSNDYSRKVHDFKSLAQTKQELAVDLQAKQEEFAKSRTFDAILESFNEPTSYTHPLKKNMKPKCVLQVLPNMECWGRSFTHAVIDKAPTLPPGYRVDTLNHAMVGNVEKRQANARMSCQLFVKALPNDDEKKKEKDGEEKEREGDDNNTEGKKVAVDRYRAVQAYDLDVLPLKEDDAPHAHYCLWVDTEKGVATYLPLSSRVQMSSGRPISAKKDAPDVIRLVQRRSLTQQERDEIEERAAEIDRDMAEKHHIEQPEAAVRRESVGESFISAGAKAVTAGDKDGVDDDDDAEDYGSDASSSDSGDEALFGGGAKTIVAEG